MALQVEWGKLGVLMTVVVGVIVLGALGVLSEANIVGILGTVVGYTAGNGRLASKNREPVPMIRSAQRSRRITDEL